MKRSVALTILFLIPSMYNYPGGYALMRMNVRFDGWFLKIEGNRATSGRNGLAYNAVAAYRCVFRSDGY